MTKTKMAVMASGDGSNFEAIVTAANSSRLDAEIVGLLVNREGCGALARADRLKIPSSVFSRIAYPSADAWNEAMKQQLLRWQAEWVVLAGFTGLIGSSILAEFHNRVVNSHPSLLPKFGGKGMYGSKVHAAVVAAGETETGVTIHLLNERFDEGPVVAQIKVPVQKSDSAETLAERVKTTERVFYPQVLQELLTGRIKSR